MTVLLTIVLPIFAIILAGYLCGRFRLLGPESTVGLNQFVYWVALPALLFKAMAEVDLEELFDGAFWGSYVGGQALTLALALLIGRWLFRHDLAASGIHGMNSIYGNTGFLGIPLALAAFGDAATLPTIITVVVNSALVVAAAILIIELAQNHGNGIGRAFKDVGSALIRNPMLIAPALGLLWALLGQPLPAPVERFMALLGASAGPCALFAIGLFLVGKPLAEDVKEVSVWVLIKLLLHPAITWVLATWVFALPPLWAAVAVVMAATPTGAGSFVLAQQYQLQVQRTSAVILISTLLSVLTLFALLQYYSPLLVL